MDSNCDGSLHESSAKRFKYDLIDSNYGELCNGNNFPNISSNGNETIDYLEGTSADCDSGYEASALESLQTLQHAESSGDTQDTLSGELLKPSENEIDHTDMSQDDSMEDKDDNESTISHLSDLNGLSDLSDDWKPMPGSMIWIQKQMQTGVDPRNLLSKFGVDLQQVPQYVNDVTLWKLIINMLAEPPRRQKMRHINTLDDIIRLIKGAQNIIVLTGAGVSVSCGIPDFRSKNGIYSRLAVDFPNLPHPQAMFDINFFNQDPRPFFKFARDIYPGKFQPSPCHKFIKILEKHNKLLRNYTQNIDTLEKVANIEKVIECHGSFATATCTKCGHKVTADKIRDIVLIQKIPLCEICHEGKTSYDTQINDEDNNANNQQWLSLGIMKPDIVFFGEGLPDTFHEALSRDKLKCDLLLVIGSSLNVRPVALIPNSLPPKVPQILINREPLPHYHFDIELLGDCDVIVNHLCHLFGGTWKEGIYNGKMLEEAPHLLPLENDSQDIDEKITFTVDESYLCKYNDSSTNGSSSFMIETNNCICYNDNDNSSNNDDNSNNNNTINKQSSIINKQSTLVSDYVNSLDCKSNKERHMSIDSARDSGIGENSNFTDSETKYDDNISLSDDNLEINEKNYEDFNNKNKLPDMNDYWQPKIQKNLADRLPVNSFYLIQPSRYIFPGAEIYYDSDRMLDLDDFISMPGYSETKSDSNISSTDLSNNSC